MADRERERVREKKGDKEAKNRQRKVTEGERSTSYFCFVSYICINVCMHACKYVCLCFYTYVCVYMYIDTHVFLCM